MAFQSTDDDLRPSGVPRYGLGASRGELIGLVVAIGLTMAIAVSFLIESGLLGQ